MQELKQARESAQQLRSELNHKDDKIGGLEMSVRSLQALKAQLTHHVEQRKVRISMLKPTGDSYYNAKALGLTGLI
jgi:prefoldin subunit 5